MAVGSSLGDIAVFDLEKRELIASVTDAHSGNAIASCEFAPGEPVLISGSCDDNSIKMWVFDNADGSGRLLRSRSGHSGAVTKVRYYGDEATSVLSASVDGTFRLFSTIQDQRNAVLSAKAVTDRREGRPLTTVVTFDAATPRERDWSNVVTAHSGDCNAYLWRTETKAITGELILPTTQQPVKRAVTAVALSACGNFAFIGSGGGWIDQYSTQSGHHRGSFCLVEAASAAAAAAAESEAPLSQAEIAAGKRRKRLLDAVAKPAAVSKNFDRFLSEKAKKKKGRALALTDPTLPAHDGAVTGLAPCAVNKHLVTSGLDKTLKWWDMDTREVIAVVPLGTCASQLEIHRDSGMVAAACDDLTVRIYNIATRRCVRRMTGHTNR